MAGTGSRRAAGRRRHDPAPSGVLLGHGHGVDGHEGHVPGEQAPLADVLLVVLEQLSRAPLQHQDAGQHPLRLEAPLDRVRHHAPEVREPVEDGLLAEPVPGALGLQRVGGQVPPLLEAGLEDVAHARLVRAARVLGGSGEAPPPRRGRPPHGEVGLLQESRPLGCGEAEHQSVGVVEGMARGVESHVPLGREGERPAADLEDVGAGDFPVHGLDGRPRFARGVKASEARRHGPVREVPLSRQGQAAEQVNGDVALSAVDRSTRERKSKAARHGPRVWEELGPIPAFSTENTLGKAMKPLRSRTTHPLLKGRRSRGALSSLLTPHSSLAPEVFYRV